MDTSGQYHHLDHSNQDYHPVPESFSPTLPWSKSPSWLSWSRMGDIMWIMVCKYLLGRFKERRQAVKVAPQRSRVGLSWWRRMGGSGSSPWTCIVGSQVSLLLGCLTIQKHIVSASLVLPFSLLKGYWLSWAFYGCFLADASFLFLLDRSGHGDRWQRWQEDHACCRLCSWGRYSLAQLYL